MTTMTIDSPLRPDMSAPSGRSVRHRSGPPARAVSATRTVHARPGRVRLTRRGRLLLVLALGCLLFVAFSLGRTSADATHARPPARATTVVHAGDTLWSIARRVAPGADPRVTVDRLSRLNDLGARPIVAGQRLVLPR